MNYSLSCGNGIHNSAQYFIIIVFFSACSLFLPANQPIIAPVIHFPSESNQENKFMGKKVSWTLKPFVCFSRRNAENFNYIFIAQILFLYLVSFSSFIFPGKMLNHFHSTSDSHWWNHTSKYKLRHALPLHVFYKIRDILDSLGQMML